MPIETEIPNLVGGVTQQAENLRFPAQVDEMVDRIPSIVHGNTDRNGTDYLAKLAGESYTREGTFFHGISRDSLERYLVTINDGNLKVFDAVTAEEKTVTFPDGTDYLLGEGNAKNFSALTIADTTFVNNKFIPIQASASSVTDGMKAEALIHIKQGAYDTDYSVILSQENGAVITVTFDLNTVSVPPFTFGQPYYLTQFTHTITGVTIVDGGSDYVGDQEVEFTWLGGADSDDWPTLTLHESGGSLTTHTLSAGVFYVALAGVAGPSNPAASEPSYFLASSGSSGYGKVTFKSGDSDLSRNAETGVIASNLKNKLGLVTAIKRDFDVAVNGNVITLTAKDDTPFEIDVDDGLADAGMGVVFRRVDTLSDLPTRAPNGFKVKIAGDAEENADDYYVTFETTDGTEFSKGVWVETTGWGVLTSLNKATMPHILQRGIDGTFVFKEADWADIFVGDADTNPLPSFEGKVINNMHYLQQRLVLLTGDSVICSETDQPFNFFKTTVTQALQTQPIDLDITGAEASALQFALPHEGNLLLMSEQNQYVLDLSRGFSFDTVSLSQATRTDIDVGATPESVNADTFFCYPRGDYIGLKQLSIEPDTLKLKAFDVSEHLPSYIKGKPMHLTALTAESMLLIQTEGLAGGCYFYRFMDRNRERIQSAYGKLVFGGTLLFSYVLDSLVYLVIDREGDVVLERWNPSVGNTTTGDAVHTILDLKITESELVSISLDVPTQVTTLTLPYKVKSGDVIYLCGRGAQAGTVLAQTVGDGSSTLEIAGDYSATNFYIGTGFTSYVDLSRPVMLQQSSGTKAITGGRFQVLNGRLTVNDSRPFNVEVKLKYRDSYTYTLRAEDLRQIEETPVATMDGDYRFAVYAKSDDVDVVLSNPTPFPCSWLSLAWEGRFQKRNQASRNQAS